MTAKGLNINLTIIANPIIFRLCCFMHQLSRAFLLMVAGFPLLCLVWTEKVCVPNGSDDLKPPKDKGCYPLIVEHARKPTLIGKRPKVLEHDDHPVRNSDEFQSKKQAFVQFWARSSNLVAYSQRTAAAFSITLRAKTSEKLLSGLCNEASPTRSS